jgi:four helix bundle protein
MSINKFEEVESWKEARVLTNNIYSVSNSDKFKSDFGLKDQIRRASVSIMANIAEGFDSASNKSFINFLNYSFRSASEVQSLLYVALDQNYISTEEFDSIYNQCSKIKSLIGGFIRYLKQTK